MKSRLAVAALNNAVARRGDVAGCVVHTRPRIAISSPEVRPRPDPSPAWSDRWAESARPATTRPWRSFFALLQKNVLDRRSWATREELRIAIVTWIERTYHRRRRQAALGRLTPVDEAAFEPQSRRPRSSPNRTPQIVRDGSWRCGTSWSPTGWMPAPTRSREMLAREGVTTSRATVWRVLTAAGRVAPQPQKRPRSSWRRFAADRPNELWQSDFTHVLLSTGHEVEVIGWLDDHSRYLLHLSVHRRVTGRTVTDTFTTAAQEHGYPTATLTDNGMVYTTRLRPRRQRPRRRRRRTRSRPCSPTAGITQKNGKPFKPTTQGKIERFWQTLKKHLAAHPTATLTELQRRAGRVPRLLQQRPPAPRPAPSNTRVRLPADPEGHPDPTRRPRTSGESATTPSTATGRSASATHGRMLHLGIGTRSRQRGDHLPHPQQRRHHQHPRHRRNPRRIHPQPRPRLPTQKRMNPRNRGFIRS